MTTLRTSGQPVAHAEGTYRSASHTSRLYGEVKLRSVHLSEGRMFAEITKILQDTILDRCRRARKGSNWLSGTSSTWAALNSESSLRVKEWGEVLTKRIKLETCPANTTYVSQDEIREASYQEKASMLNTILEKHFHQSLRRSKPNNWPLYSTSRCTNAGVFSTRKVVT